MFCWQCGGSFNRRPDGSEIFAEVTVSNWPRKVHLSCELMTHLQALTVLVTRQPRDEVPYEVAHYPEHWYG
jgi:hypothetical protein